ncbi:MAG: sigma-54-dependent Fis family transcriptional regulator [Pseudomonadales bacterium]|nr:sigma-54-dependent Fis family transcriptional regulator [Pseudomonadales bacterium]PCJ62266.1 MAG: hypothetical protein COA79_04175 [Planctomycetota bacterium]
MSFIDAWLNEDQTAMDNLLKKSSKNKKLHQAYEAIINSNNSDSLKFKSLINVIEDPPDDLEIYSLLLYLAADVAYATNNFSELNRIIQIYQNLDLSKIKSICKSLFYLSLARLELSKNMSDQQLESEIKAESLYPKGSIRWYKMKAKVTLGCILHKKEYDISKAIKILKGYPQFSESTFPPEYLQARYYESIGKLSLAYQEINKIKNIAIFGKFGENIFSQKVKLLWRAGKIEEGDIELEKYLNMYPELIGNRSGKFLLAERSMLLNDSNGTKQHLKEILADKKVLSLSRFWANYLLLCAELAQRQTVSARRILNTMDPEGTNKGLFTEWVRLYTQEDNYRKAAYYFKKMQEDRPNYLLEFHYAHEMRASQITKLILTINDEEFNEVKSVIEKPHYKIDDTKDSFENFIGTSESINTVKENIQKYANQSAPVLITGATGTGKEETAKLLHKLSDRSKEPFIPVNCGAISNTLMEAELFGYKKGAFTGAMKDHKGLFESAGKGTIFLDEISSMPMPLQASLLRVLENMIVRPVGSTKFIPIEARVIAATNISLEILLEQKTFRMDLYFRLNRLQINLPSLQDRRDDIPLLIQHFLGHHFNLSDTTIDKNLLDAMQEHSWPGNIRELKNEIERMAIITGNNKLITNELVNFKSSEIKENIAPIDIKQKSFVSDENKITPMTQENIYSPPNISLEKGVKNYSEYRRQELRQLFQQHRLLTRAMVVRFLGCAANTAAKDLKSLETAGYLKKVIPTDSPRSSYYILNDKN